VYLRREGTGRWSVGDEGATFELADLKGLSYLRYLIERPGTDVGALLLAGQGTEVIEESDLGDVLDPAALAAYRRRLAELDTELGRADQRGDRAAATGLSAERAALLAQVRAATGLGGRPRRVGGSAERARVAVRKAIAAALARIEQREPGVARLLRGSIRTGMVCRYEPNPDQPVTWITD
jgi:hypothetical protein